MPPLRSRSGSAHDVRHADRLVVCAPLSDIHDSGSRMPPERDLLRARARALPRIHATAVVGPLTPAPITSASMSSLLTDSTVASCSLPRRGRPPSLEGVRYIRVSLSAVQARP